MTIELTPLGITCNIGCTYCYQDPMRDAGNLVNGRYDMEKMKAALLREGHRFSVFGGEPLLMPLPELEELWRFGLEHFGPKMKPGQWVNAVQTNGTLITPAHVAAFRKYQVSVGISIDGPGELNDARWAKSLERTREQTAKTEAAIRLLCADGNIPSIIVTLHRLNASAERLPRFAAWFRELDALGIRHVRLHVLEIDSPMARARLQLDTQETIAAFLAMADLEPSLQGIRFDVFKDIEWLLSGRDQEQGKYKDEGVTCTWNPCDPLTTSAVSGIDGQGERTNCGRTNKDGINWRKADRAGFERQLALYHTPQEHGGCQGCRFFFACKGQCPGTAFGGDWRNRSEGCPLWMAMFEHVEARMVKAGQRPLSLDPNLPVLEQRLLTMWAAGYQGSVREALTARPVRSGSAHGDWHGDDPHGDSPHGDSTEHADHTDQALLESIGSREEPLGIAEVLP